MESLRLTRASFGDTSLTYVRASNLGLFLLNRGRLNEAEPLLAEAVAGYARLDEHSDDAASASFNLAALRLRQRRFEDALPLLEAAAGDFRDPAERSKAETVLRQLRQKLDHK
jgi:tetratricopeptide (TPR) repeat protein